MIASWRPLKIGDFLSLEYGKPLDKSKRKEDGLYPAYGANGIKCRSDEFYSDAKTIIVGRKGSAGEITLTEDRFWPLDVTYFVKFDNTKYNLKFIYHLLSQLNLPSLATGVKPGINRNNVYALDVFIPELPEQKRIVSILDQAFADIDKARANAEQNLKNARELFESYLQQVFSQRGEGWVDTDIESLVEAEILDKPLDGNHGDIHPKKADFVEAGVPFVMASDINDGAVDTEHCNFISKSQADSLRKGFAKDGDVLLSHKATIGRAAILKTELDYVMLTPQVTYYRVLDRERMSNEYVYWYFNNPIFLNEMYEYASVGSTRAYIGITKQRELKLSYPDITKQKEIVLKLTSLAQEMELLEPIYKKKLIALDELKKSILQKAFTGELTNSQAIGYAE